MSPPVSPTSARLVTPAENTSTHIRRPPFARNTSVPRLSPNGPSVPEDYFGHMARLNLHERAQLSSPDLFTPTSQKSDPFPTRAPQPGRRTRSASIGVVEVKPPSAVRSLILRCARFLLCIAQQP